MAGTSNFHPSGFDTIMLKFVAIAVDRLLHYVDLISTEGPSMCLKEALSGRGVVVLGAGRRA